MVSMFSGCSLNLCIRPCSGVQCLLTRCFTAFCIGLKSGCVGGSVVSLIAALCRILSTRVQKGSRLAMISRISVAVVFLAPVIIIAACCWIDASLFITAWLLGDDMRLLPAFCWGVRNMSAAKTCGGWLWISIAAEYIWLEFLLRFLQVC